MGNGVWLVDLDTFTLILNYDCLAGRNDYWQSKNRKVFESWKFEVNIIELPSWKHAFFFSGISILALGFPVPFKFYIC